MRTIADGKITISTEIDSRGAEKGVSNLKGKLQGTADKARAVGGNMTKYLTVPMLAIGGAAIKIGADFDDAMAHVQAVTGSTEDQMGSLRDMAKDLGESTEFSASQAAEGMGYLGMAGFETNEILESMPGLLDLATAGQLDLASASDIASNILSGFGLEASDIGRVSDVLAKSAASANTSVEQMGDAMSYVAPVAAGAGVSLEETSGAIGILSDAGIQGQRAGTSLRRMIASLQNPTGETKTAMEELGLSMEDVDPSANSLSEILGNLESAGIDSSQAMKLVGTEAGPSLIALLEQGESGLSEFTNNLKGAEGSAKDMAQTMRDTTKGGFKELWSSIESLALSLYEALRPAIQKVTEFVTMLARQFNSLSPNVKTIIAVVGVLVAALGPVLLMFGLLVPAITAVSLPMLGIVVAITAVIAIVVALATVVITNWDKIKAATLIVWEGIKIFFQTTWNIIKTIFMTTIQGIWAFIQGTWNLIKTVTMTVWNSIKTFFNTVWVGIKLIVQSAIIVIKNIITSVWNAIKSVTSTVWNGIKSFLSGLWNGIKSTASSLFDGIKSVISTVWNTIKSVSSKVWNGIKGTLSGIWNGLKSKVSNAFNTIKDTISGVWDSVKSSTDKIWDGITSSVKSAINGVISAINGMINALNSLDIKLPKIPDWVPGMGGKGGGSIGFPNIPSIPSLDVGTNFVAADGLAYLHQGEAVVPKEYNPAVGGGNIDYDKLGMTMAKYLKFDFNVDGEKLTESVNTHNAVDNRINKF